LLLALPTTMTVARAVQLIKAGTPKPGTIPCRSRHKLRGDLGRNGDV
jgi:hypothetical protein